MNQRIFSNQFKAIDAAKWLNYIDRSDTYNYIICRHGKNEFRVTEARITHKKPSTWLDIIPANYTRMSYDHIGSIYSDIDPLSHMEDIKGMFSILNNQILLFILQEKIPLEKFIKKELASRGYDNHNTFIGFKAAEKLWLK